MLVPLSVYWSPCYQQSHYKVFARFEELLTQFRRFFSNFKPKMITSKYPSLEHLPPRALKCILEKTNYATVCNMAKVSTKLRDIIRSSRIHTTIYIIRIELSMDEIFIDMERNDSDDDCNNAGALYRQTPLGCEVKHILRDEWRCLPGENMFDIAYNDLKEGLRLLPGSIEKLHISCGPTTPENSLGMRAFLEKLGVFLASLHPYSLRVEILSMHIPPDESLVMSILPHLDKNPLWMLVLVNVNRDIVGTMETIRLDQVMGTEQWNQLEDLVVCQALQVLAPIARMEHINTDHVNHHPDSIREYELALAVGRDQNGIEAMEE